MDYVAPNTVADAITALVHGKGAARLLAGGTDLLVQVKTGRVRAPMVIDLKRIPELIGIRQEEGGFVIGAATPGAEIGEHAALRRAWPGLVEAANLIGSTQVQGRASIGGNLCNASPAADSVPALIAAGAVCIIEGPNGRREMPAEQVQASPGKTNLAPDEILVALRLPPRPTRSSDAYLRLIPRSEMDIAVVGVGVNLTLDGAGLVKAARIGLGAVAPVTLLVEDAANALIGSKLEDAAMAKAEAAMRAACKPINDKRGTVEYRIKIAGVLTRRAAQIAYERAQA